MKILVGHLYPDYLNIYADRGNIAVLERRAAWRGHELEVARDRPRRAARPGEHDLLYIGGGQDREQALVAPDLAAQGGRAARRQSSGGAAVLAVCGGYQLLGPLLPRPRRATSCRASACFRCTRSPASGG